jgi:hypothetical protein
VLPRWSPVLHGNSKILPGSVWAWASRVLFPSALFDGLTLDPVAGPPVQQRIESFLVGQPRAAAFCRDCLAVLLQVPRAMLDGPVRELVGDRTRRATLGPCAACGRVAPIVTPGRTPSFLRAPQDRS